MILKFSAAVILFFLSAGHLSADIIILRDRERVMGLVVEEYKDRIIVSTPDGEREIMKRDIREMKYDLEEQNHTQKGNVYRDRGMYFDAYQEYARALDINPEYKPAREGLDHIGAIIQLLGRKMREDHVERMNIERDWRMRAAGPDGGLSERFVSAVGFSVVPFGINFKVEDVRPLSPASRAGIKEGDVIIALWGRLVGYKSPEEFMSDVIYPQVREVKFVVDRDKEIEVSDSQGGPAGLIGARLSYDDEEGFRVSAAEPEGRASASGIRYGDVVVAVDGKSTRYMRQEEMLEKLEEKKGSTVTLTVRRDISVWKT